MHIRTFFAFKNIENNCRKMTVFGADQIGEFLKTEFLQTAQRGQSDNDTESSENGCNNTVSYKFLWVRAPCYYILLNA